jgi:hypothetical protein
VPVAESVELEAASKLVQVTRDLVKMKSLVALARVLVMVRELLTVREKSLLPLICLLVLFVRCSVILSERPIPLRHGKTLTLTT